MNKYDIYEYTKHASDTQYGWTVCVTATDDTLSRWIVTRRRHGYEYEEIGEFKTIPNPQKRIITKMVKTIIRQHGIDINNQAKEIRLKGDNQYEDDDSVDYVDEEEKQKYYKLFAKDVKEV